MGCTPDNSDHKINYVTRVWCWICHFPNKWQTSVVENAATAKKLARDDPRRVVHSFKVGLALTLVSLFYYLQPLYDSFGVSAMWAVITVVVVFEFTVGATLGKGLNRATATLIAGGLGIGAHHLASLCGKIGEPILIGLFVYIFAATSTFIRFFPKIKARYDYGFLIFILTFCMVSISGYRTSEIIELAHKRLTTIAIGGCVSLIVNTLICPVWAGEELHNSIALNLEKLGYFLEGFGAANFARWEPGHGQFGYHHPWKQYIKLGSLIRQCAYRVDALSAYFKPHLQVLQKQEKFQEEIREACTKISLESSKTLNKLGSCLKSMKHPSSSSVNAHIISSKTATENLKTFLKTESSSLYINQHPNILQIIPVATMASLLIDIVDIIEKILESACDLATLADFDINMVKEYHDLEEKSKFRTENEAVNQGYCAEVVVTVAELAVITDQVSSHPDSEGQN
ncbi:Aluminum-activated malate transporter 2 [Bienertia sinuspersici]